MDPSTGGHQEMGNPSNGQWPQPEEALKCPRCESTNTKFCYYNNYSLSQPRYFCKSCRRYWTKGGTLRKVPVGGGCRKTKRSSPSSKRTQDQTLTPSTNPIVPPLSYDAGHLSILGNPSLNVAGSVANPAFHGNFNNSHGFGYDSFWEAGYNDGPTVGFNGETMIPYNIEDMIDSTTTSDVAVTMMKQDSSGNSSVLWGLPWQLIPDAADNNNNDNMVVGTDLDSVGDNWHGLLNSLLM